MKKKFQMFYWKFRNKNKMKKELNNSKWKKHFDLILQLTSIFCFLFFLMFVFNSLKQWNAFEKCFYWEIEFFAESEIKWKNNLITDSKELLLIRLQSEWQLLWDGYVCEHMLISAWMTGTMEGRFNKGWIKKCCGRWKKE